MQDERLRPSCSARVKLLALSNWCELECVCGHIQLQISSLLSDGFIGGPLGEEQTRSRSPPLAGAPLLAWLSGLPAVDR